ncbi:MAG TPA: GntG family PLP-dependent aldolase [Bacteroidia bacterium]|nr:GntG family PLP-dependent aldolase [Bacteroidia bacterium]
MIDLRSDTVTRPTKEMLEAMFSAKLGDDVFGEDPTINALEEKCANLFSKEAGVFCPSGTMTNQIAINIHTEPGDELLCDVNSHIYNFEGGGISRNSGVQAKLIQGDRGRISAQQVKENMNPTFDWLTRTSLVSVENTANRSGGSFYTLNTMQEIATVCKENKLKFHLDGARIFNALVETKETPSQIGKCVDSISVCLSKGLGAPVGSVLLGDKEFIRKARRVRKVFGGGMRQAGILAAAGIYALDNNVERLKDDHKRAKILGETLKKLFFVEHILPVETNIVIFTLSEKMPSELFVKKLASENIKVSAFGKQTIRLVTHLDFTDEMLDKTISVLNKMN